MAFKLGLFENPYVADEDATAVRSDANMLAGFAAQKKAIVMLLNRAHEVEPPVGSIFYTPPDTATSFLPIDGSRFTDADEDGTADAGEYDCDANADGTIAVYYDGVVDGLVSNPDAPDQLTTILGGYDYTSAGGDGALPIASVDSLENADIAILRVTSRKGYYFGYDAGVPLSFDGPFTGEATDDTIAAAITDRNRVIDALRVRDGYTTSNGTAVAPANPDLRIIVVMHMDRPGIVEPFIQGLTTLDETPGVPNSYPLVSDTANHDTTGRTGIDGFLVEFGAFDRAVLDFLFNTNQIEGWTYGSAVLPMELPSTDEAVAAQYEDVPADSLNPTFRLGSGMTY